MSNLPLFDETSEIAHRFDPEASLVLYQGDTNDFLDTLPDNAIKLIVSSPPYNLGKEYEDRVSIEHYLEQQSHIIEKLNRVLHPQGSICWQVGNFVEKGEVFPLDIYYYPIFKRLGLQLRNRVIWHFEHGLHTSKRFSGRYETLLWFTKTGEYTFNLDPVRVPSKYPGKRHYKGPNKGKPSGNPLGKNPSDVWDLLAQEWDDGFWEIPNVKANHPEKTIHPCQYPIELVERCVLALTDEGDWVYDPYAGVGSAMIAAAKRGRRGMGSEQDETYVAIARERLAAFLNGQLKVRPLGRPVHKPTGRERISKIPTEWETVEQKRLLERGDEYQ